MARRGLRALCPEWARATGLGVELDGLSGLERLNFAGGAGDGLGAQVDLEVAFGEEAWSIAQRPGLGEYASLRREHVIDDGAVDVGAIDVELDES